MVSGGPGHSASSLVWLLGRDELKAGLVRTLCIPSVTWPLHVAVQVGSPAGQPNHSPNHSGLPEPQAWKVRGLVLLHSTGEAKSQSSSDPTWKGKGKGVTTGAVAPWDRPWSQPCSLPLVMTTVGDKPAGLCLTSVETFPGVSTLNFLDKLAPATVAPGIPD